MTKKDKECCELNYHIQRSAKKLFIVFSVLVSMPIFSSSDTGDFNLTEVVDGVYVHLGKHVSIDDRQHDDIANIGFIIGNDCIAVIDTGGSIRIGNQLRKKIRSISKKPICYIINTHVHFDHVLGNKAFIKENPVFIGHQKLADAIEQNRAFFLTQFKDDLGNQPDANSIIGPDKLITDMAQIDLGARILTLKAYPVSHSHNDLTVMDNKTKTLWSGDLIFRERLPSLTGNLVGWVNIMEGLKTLDIKKVIPGHGSIANSMMDAIEQQQTYLKTLLTETRRAIADGVFINDAIKHIGKENHSGWLLYEFQHPANVSKAFIELEWE